MIKEEREKNDNNNNFEKTWRQFELASCKLLSS